MMRSDHSSQLRLDSKYIDSDVGLRILDMNLFYGDNSGIISPVFRDARCGESMSPKHVGMQGSLMHAFNADF